MRNGDACERTTDRRGDPPLACPVVRHIPRFGLHRNGWPISLEVGNTNSTSKFAFPTAEAMGHPTVHFARSSVRVMLLWVLAATWPAFGQDEEAFRVLPRRVVTRHYEVMGTAPPNVLLQLGQDMDFIHDAYDREFRFVLAGEVNRKPLSKRARARLRREAERAARRARQQQRKGSKSPTTRPTSTTKDRLIVFATRAQFNAWRARFTPNVQPWANAYFTSRLRALVGHLEGGFAKAYPSFFHEGFHQFMHRYVPRAPIWLNEGLAEYYEQAQLQGGVWRFPPQSARIRQCAALWKAHRLTPLAELLIMDRKTFYGGQAVETPASRRAGEHYSEAYTLVYLMLANPDTLKRLQAYVRDLATRTTDTPAAITAAHFPPDVLAALQERWINFARRY